jgi:hypothetical protein
MVVMVVMVGTEVEEGGGCVVKGWKYAVQEDLHVRARMEGSKEGKDKDGTGRCWLTCIP